MPQLKLSIRISKKSIIRLNVLTKKGALKKAPFFLVKYRYTLKHQYQYLANISQ